MLTRFVRCHPVQQALGVLDLWSVFIAEYVLGSGVWKALCWRGRDFLGVGYLAKGKKKTVPLEHQAVTVFLTLAMASCSAFLVCASEWPSSVPECLSRILTIYP